MRSVPHAKDVPCLLVHLLRSPSRHSQRRRCPIWNRLLEKGALAGWCLVHDGRRLWLVVAHVHIGIVDAQRAARERRAELSGEGEDGKVVRWEARCERWRSGVRVDVVRLSSSRSERRPPQPLTATRLKARVKEEVEVAKEERWERW